MDYRMRPSEWKTRTQHMQPQLLRVLHDHWGVDSIRPINCTSWNAVFEATGNGVHAAAKVYNPGNVFFEAGDPALVARTCRALKISGCDMVAQPIPAMNGSLSVHSDETHIVLYEWVDGKTPEEHDISACAYALAAINSTSPQSLGVDGFSRPRIFAPAITPSQWFSKQDEQWAAAGNRVRAYGGSTRDIQLLDEGKVFSSQFLTDHPNFYASLRENHILHGDFRPSNILVDKDGRPHVIDMDCLQVGDPVIDAAVSAITFAGSEWFTCKVVLEQVDQFLALYCHASKQFKIYNDPKHLHAALKWVSIRALSRVYKADQIEGRIAVLRQFMNIKR